MKLPFMRVTYFVITQFIYNLHESGWTHASSSQTWYNNTLRFIEEYLGKVD